MFLNCKQFIIPKKKVLHCNFSYDIRKRSKTGMSHIPEDRHKYGLVLDYTLEQNMVLQRYWQEI